MLFPHDCQHLAHRLQPHFTEHGGVSALLPVFIGKTDRVAVGVEFPFTFEHIRIRLRPVGGVRLPHRLHIEGIGIRVDAYAFELTVYHSGYHSPKIFILTDISHIRPDLSPGVAKPHSMDIAGIDIGIRLSVSSFHGMNGGVESVRIAVGEHPSQTRVLQHRAHPLYLSLDCFRPEKPVLRLGTAVCIFLRFFRTVPYLGLRSHGQHKFSSRSNILISDISLCICPGIEGDLLDISVLVAAAFGSDLEDAARDIDFHGVEERRAEPVTS